MKGICLAGGFGTRLSPTTKVISKQLHCVYNKPMVYYPIKTLVDMGIKDILIIVADLMQYKLFQDQLVHLEKEGINVKFKIQYEPGGIPEAFIIGEEFIGEDDVTLILGDNVIITPNKLEAKPNTIFTYRVDKPEAYGVAVVENKKLVSIVEKPKEFVSDTAVIGLYAFSNSAVRLAKQLTRSARNELEIVDLISILNETEGVTVEELDGFWFDCGTHDDLLDCANLVRAIEQRTNKRIGL